VWRMAAIAHRFKCRIDLAERGLSDGGVPPPLDEEHQRNAFVPKTHGPVERHSLARPFLQRLAIGGDRLLQPCTALLARAERLQRIAEIALRHGPVERHTLARAFFQRVAIGGDGLFELRLSALAFSKYGKRIAEIALRHGPVERHALARAFPQRLAIG